MKKVMVMTIMFLLVGASLASAQTTTIFTGKLLNPDRTGPLTVALTEQKDTANGGRVFVPKVKTIGGGDAHFDIAIDDTTGNPTAFDIWGYTKQPMEPSPTVKHIITCPASEFRQIATDPDDPEPYPHVENLKAVILCAFNPNGVDGNTDGVAYLDMKGTSTKLTVQPNAIGKFVFSGTVGGAYNQADNNFVFKGSFGTVLKPQAPGD